MSTSRALRSSYRFCAASSRRNARNFFYAFLLLPGPLRRSMCALYAFLRHTDDLADEAASPAWKAEAIESWRLELDAALAGRESHWPGLPALADTVARHGIPVHLLHEVIEGVSMDVEPRRYATFADLARLLPSCRVRRRPVLPAYLGLSFERRKSREARRSLWNRSSVDQYHSRRPRRCR